MPDDTKIFDVSKPGRTAAAPTSRPIIPDQNSTGIDNMVKDYSQPNPTPNQLLLLLYMYRWQTKNLPKL
jgi:hypothetical protein